MWRGEGKWPAATIVGPGHTLRKAASQRSPPPDCCSPLRARTRRARQRHRRPERPRSCRERRRRNDFGVATTTCSPAALAMRTERERANHPVRAERLGPAHWARRHDLAVGSRGARLDAAHSGGGGRYPVGLPVFVASLGLPAFDPPVSRSCLGSWMGTPVRRSEVGLRPSVA